MMEPNSWPMRVWVMPPVRRSRRRIEGFSAPPMKLEGGEMGGTCYECVDDRWRGGMGIDFGIEGNACDVLR
jgi:hypothetical protein